MLMSIVHLLGGGYLQSETMACVNSCFVVVTEGKRLQMFTYLEHVVLNCHRVLVKSEIAVN